jgi:hypothetical protein
MIEIDGVSKCVETSRPRMAMRRGLMAPDSSELQRTVADEMQLVG